MCSCFASVLCAMLLSLLSLSSRATSTNQQSGTCQELDLFITTVGVEDSMGDHHKGKAGWTEGGFDAYARAGQVHWTTSHGQQCLREVVTTRAIAKPVTNVIDWTLTPTPCNTCGACQMAFDAWVNKLAAHEAMHASNAIAEAAKCRPESFTIKACGQTRAAAIKAAQAQLKSKVKNGCSGRAFSAWSASEDAFDKSPPGQVPAPACDGSCQACATGQNPFCKRPCGPFDTVQGLYPACGKNPQSNQPVACCRDSADQSNWICSPLGTSACP